MVRRQHRAQNVECSLHFDLKLTLIGGYFLFKADLKLKANIVRMLCVVRIRKYEKASAHLMQLSPTCRALAGIKRDNIRPSDFLQNLSVTQPFIELLSSVGQRFHGDDVVPHFLRASIARK